MRKLKKIVLGTAIFVLGIAMTACGGEKKEESKQAEKVELHILAAASMTDVLTELEKSFEKEHENIDLVCSYDSSGTLQTQIEEGAPADVFVSAATKQMNELKDEKLIEEDSIIELLENKVVLIKPKGSELAIESFEDAATDQVDMIAIGNSDVPVGQYTQTLYENLNLWDTIEEKANFGTNVRQVLDWVATKNADCGIVYATDAAIEDGVEVVCEAPEGACDPVIYPAGIVKASEYKEEAQEYLNFLKTEEARKAFEKYKFTYIYEEE